MIKAVFFDCDDTLLSHRSGSVPPSAAEALRVLGQKGILRILSTGRHVSELNELKPIEGLEFDAYITLNGACTYDAQGIFDSHPITEADIRTAYDWLCGHPLPVQFLEETASYINFVNDTVERAQAMIHTPVPEQQPLARILEHPVYMMIPFGINAAEELISSLQDVKWTKWHAHDAVDIIHRDTGKAQGMKAVLQKYGILQSETAAFGDAMNDMEMVKYAGIGIAMGNGDPALRQEADMVTEDIDRDGVASALHRLGIL